MSEEKRRKISLVSGLSRVIVEIIGNQAQQAFGVISVHGN
jgi:hypothetical protein